MSRDFRTSSRDWGTVAGYLCAHYPRIPMANHKWPCPLLQQRPGTSSMLSTGAALSSAPRTKSCISPSDLRRTRSDDMDGYTPCRGTHAWCWKGGGSTSSIAALDSAVFADRPALTPSLALRQGQNRRKSHLVSRENLSDSMVPQFSRGFRDLGHNHQESRTSDSPTQP